MNALNSHLPAICILGVGHHLPMEYEDNESLCRNLEVTPQWIVEKTGIERRYIAGLDDTAWSYAVSAALQALEMAGVLPSQLGLIVVCTASGDYQFPPMSAKVAQQIEAPQAQIFDLQANCAGMISGLTVASDRLRVEPAYGYAIVIGVELHTRLIDKTDFNTSIYLGDAAGAIVLGISKIGGGIQAAAFCNDTSNYEAVRRK